MARIGIFYIVLLSICFACTTEHERKATNFLTRAESLVKSEPETACALLDSMGYPERLSGKLNARWCLLRGKLADTLHTDLPYPGQLERAKAYYERHGSASEQAQIGLYLGRAYMNDKLAEPAIQYYSEALAKSLENKDYNLAGYICSYMGDVYKYQKQYVKAKEKYMQAASYFHQAGNKRSQGFAFWDTAREYAKSDSLDMALCYMNKADSLLQLYGDSADIATVYNGLGNIYAEQKKWDLAESFLWKSIQLKNHTASPSYEALAILYLEKEEFEKAYNCLIQAQAPTTNTNTHKDILYLHAQIEKERGNLSHAVNYLEQYIDSTYKEIKTINNNNVIDAEKKYQHEQILKENIGLKVSKERNFHLWIYTIIAALITSIILLYRLNRRNKQIYNQEIQLKQNSNELLTLRNELLTKQKELNDISIQLQSVHTNAEMEESYIQKEQEIEELNILAQKQKEQTLQTSPIALRLKKLSAKVKPNMQKSLLTAKDWDSIRELVHLVSPQFQQEIAVFNFSPKEEELCYLSFFPLDTNEKAILLNLSVSSVNRYRQNIRQAFQINDRKTDLRDFLLRRRQPSVK